MRETQISQTRKCSKLSKNDPNGPPQNYLENNSKNTKIYFEESLVFFEFFFGTFWVGNYGSFLVIFEYSRVRGIWVSLTGALNRNTSDSNLGEGGNL